MNTPYIGPAIRAVARNLKSSTIPKIAKFKVWSNHSAAGPPGPGAAAAANRDFKLKSGSVRFTAAAAPSTVTVTDS